MEMFEFFETDDLDFHLHDGGEGLLYVSITDDNGACNSEQRSVNISLGDFYKIASPDVISVFEIFLANALKAPSEAGNESGFRETPDVSLDELAAKIDGLAAQIESIGDGLSDMTSNLFNEIEGLNENTAKIAANIPSAGESERHKRLARLMKARFAADNERPQA
jgi:hypothetical protein